ncbi:MAG: DUF3187 family protein [Nitrospirales bacterium]
MPGWIFRFNRRGRRPGGRGRGGILAAWGLAALLCAPSLPVLAQEGSGPFPVRNFQPIQMLILGIPGDRALVLPKGRLDVRIEMAETSSVFDENEPRVQTTMKLETLRSAVFLRYGLTQRLEVGMELPVLYRYRGFLEGLITAAERATTGLAPARERLRDTGFAFLMTRDGGTLFSGGSGGLGLGDLTLSAKFLVLEPTPDRPAASLRVAVKAPSGDDRRFFGSGHADVGLGLAVEHRLGARWILYGNVNGIFPTGRISGLPVNPAVSVVTAAEYLVTPTFSLVGQFDYYSSPFRKTGSQVLDNGVTEVAVGFSSRIRPHILWQVYGIENVDFIQNSAADFTLSTVVTFQFGP